MMIIRRGCGAIGGVLFGLLFLAIGIAVAVLVPMVANQAAARAERLTPLTATRLESTIPGSEVLLEGQISDRNQPRYQGLVAYIEERWDSSDDEWDTVETVRGPLLIDVPGGRVQIEGTTYALDRPPSEIRDGSNRRFRGFEAGNAVTVIGIAAQGEEGVVVNAEVLASGPRSAYVEAQRTGARIGLLIGGIFAVVGFLIAAASLLGFLRGR